MCSSNLYRRYAIRLRQLLSVLCGARTVPTPNGSANWLASGYLTELLAKPIQQEYDAFSVDELGTNHAS